MNCPKCESEDITISNTKTDNPEFEENCLCCDCGEAFQYKCVICESEDVKIEDEKDTCNDCGYVYE